jgi:hypothetical protein
MPSLIRRKLAKEREVDLGLGLQAAPCALAAAARPVATEEGPVSNAQAPEEGP